MKKSNYKFNREEYMSSKSYKISDKILKIPKWILMTVATALSIVYGLMITKCSEVIKKDIIDKQMVIDIDDEGGRTLRAM